MQSIRCPACDTKLKFKDEHLGKRLKCPGCGERVNTAHLQATPTGAMGGAAAVQAERVRSRREANNAPDDRLPLPVYCAITGAVCGVIWGVLMGLVAGTCASMTSYSLLAGAEPSGGEVALMFVILIGFGALFYAVAGSLIGLTYGFSGSFAAAVGVGMAVPLLALVLGWGFGGIIISAVFAYTTCKVIETQVIAG
ncbi:MAG: hypothetical protein AAGD32_00450 [Planctomycetota bacterium]